MTSFYSCWPPFLSSNTPWTWNKETALKMLTFNLDSLLHISVKNYTKSKVYVSLVICMNFSKMSKTFILDTEEAETSKVRQVRLSRATLEFSFGFSLWSENSFVWKLTYLHTLVQKLWSRHLPDTFQASSIHIKRGFIPLEVAVNKFWITHPVGNRR